MSQEPPGHAVVRAPAIPDFWPPAAVTSNYQPSSTCEQCHDRIAEQHAQSSHAASYTNPVFRAQYFNELLPQVSTSEYLSMEARWCAACHTPIAFVQHRYAIVTQEDVDPLMSGVTCDFCHTISGYAGTTPQNGNYISTPGQDKLGPFTHKYNWHHVYGELQTRSEFCGICHNSVNHHGLEVKSTFTEWKNSRFAADGIQCQDCHMTACGFLLGGIPLCESGRAASMRVGTAPERSKLYTHRFPGAHSKTQVVGAIVLSMESDRHVAAPGDEVTVRVLVDNSRTGHKMPSGSTDLRHLWLGVDLQVGNQLIPIPAASRRETGGYDVAGQGRFDKQILADDIPAGSRIYRSVYVDAQGKQSLRSYEAVKIVFDNRLNSSEIREETYHFRIPPEAKTKVVILRASLNYLRYPSSFTNALGLPSAETVEVASAKGEIRLQ